MRALIRIVALLLVATMALPASAQTTIFTSSTSFLNAIKPGSYTETFSGPAIGDNVLSVNFSGGSGPFSYTVTANNIDGSASALYGQGTVGFIGTALSNDSMTITFTSGNVSAIGANFFLTDPNDAFQISPVTITLSNGTTTTFTPATAAEYRGFTTSTGTIASLTMAAPPSNNQFFNGLDNLTVGITAVPEPSSMALATLGLVGLAFYRRRCLLSKKVSGVIS